jgi:hypothetical protein
MILCLVLGSFASTFYVIKIREIPLSKEAKRLDKEYKRLTLGD